MQHHKTNKGVFRPLDLNITILIKYISDWGTLLKKVSPFASIAFICLNLKSIITSKRAIVCILLLVPAFIITPGADSLRLILSSCVLWIFIDKFKSPYQTFSLIVAALIGLYSCVIFAGIFFPDFYLKMGGGALRYKFILESHNALSILVFMFFIYLCNTLLMLAEKKETGWKFVALFIPFLLLIITFLFIKSRLYIGLSLLLLIIIAIKNYQKSKLLAVAPVIYFTIFVLLSQFSINLAERKTNQTPVVQTLPQEFNPVPENKDSLPIVAPLPEVSPSKVTVKPIPVNPAPVDSALKKKDGITQGDIVLDNSRLLNLSTTGRWPMIQIFFDLYSELGWKKFIYQNNTAAYLEKKKVLPGIDLNASTLTENTYLVIFLNSGFLGFFTFLFIFGYYLLHFFKRKEYFSLGYFLFLMAVWFFEETIMFPFSMITHLFALATINRFERKTYESSNSH